MGNVIRIAVLAACCLFVAAANAAAPVIEDAAGAIQDAAGDHRLLLIGEMHGTRECPQLVAALVERESMRGPVLLGVELPRDGLAAVRAYLDSDGSPRARSALRSARFLKPPGGRNDGRRSEDMLDLVERIRLLRVAGRDVSILPFDETATDGDSGRRDRAMATYLRRAYAALPSGRLVVLAGNVHAMQQRPGFAGMAGMQTPMGEHLADLSPYSVNVSAGAGGFRACAPRCQWVAARAAQDASGPAQGPFRGSFDYQIVLPEFTPARLL